MAELSLRNNEQLHPLTQLPDRLAIASYLEAALHMQAGRFALLELDIDGLKEINDTLGHYEGDLFLENVGSILRESIRREDLCIPAHKSGDEFSIILYDIKDQEEVVAIRERIRHELEEYGVEVSIGGRLHQAEESIHDLCLAADQLLYNDKIERKLARYNNPDTRRVIKHIARLAAGIPSRDLALLIRLSNEELL